MKQLGHHEQIGLPARVLRIFADDRQNAFILRPPAKPQRANRFNRRLDRFPDELCPIQVNKPDSPLVSAQHGHVTAQIPREHGSDSDVPVIPFEAPSQRVEIEGELEQVPRFEANQQARVVSTEQYRVDLDVFVVYSHRRREETRGYVLHHQAGAHRLRGLDGNEGVLVAEDLEGVLVPHVVFQLGLVFRLYCGLVVGVEYALDVELEHVAVAVVALSAASG